ncbi:protein GOLM2 isoform 2-T2 [Rhinophrynus dorsalis]
MVGFGAPRRTGRMPPFVLVALLAVIGLLAFNYWSVSARQAALHDELLGLQAQVQRTEVARSRLEKRNSELMMQADSHRRLMDQKQGEYQGLGERLQARDVQAQRCEMDKAKLQNNVSHQMSDISRLKEQLAELQQEYLRQTDQLQEYKNNNTLLQKTLQEESQQCIQQLTDRKHEYEESLLKARLGAKEEEVESLSSKNAEGEAAADNKIHAAAGEQQEDKGEEPSSNRLPFVKDAAKTRIDAGMPEIEDSDPVKEDSLPTAGKNTEVDAFPGEFKVQAERHPSSQPISFTETEAKNLLPAAKQDPVAPLGVEENALHLEELPPNPVPKDPKAMSFNLKQSRFFDENESPVDPQHGSKVADYNGDDGNVGEYEADKQAELAYNEEEDGDGGEEDVQDDDHDGQGDAAEYRKDRFSETL